MNVAKYALWKHGMPASERVRFDCLAEFFTANADTFTDHERGAMLVLQPGESFCGGGGASPQWRLERLTNTILRVRL